MTRKGEQCYQKDFKSFASTDFATRAFPSLSSIDVRLLVSVVFRADLVSIARSKLAVFRAVGFKQRFSTERLPHRTLWAKAPEHPLAAASSRTRAWRVSAAALFGPSNASRIHAVSSGSCQPVFDNQRSFARLEREAGT